jgi:hypothetical protein
VLNFGAAAFMRVELRERLLHEVPRRDAARVREPRERPSRDMGTRQRSSDAELSLNLKHCCALDSAARAHDLSICE